MNHRQLADFARKAEANRLDLPDGCFVNFDLQVIEFLKALDQQGAEKDYQALKDTLGRRPTLTEFYHFGASLQKTRKDHGSWFGLLDDMGDMSEEEAEIRETCDHFLREVETTSMTKSFKMILLEAFQALGGWRQPPTVAALSAESWNILRRKPRLFAELAVSVQTVDGSSSQWQSYWKKNPVDHWTNKAPPHFQVNDGRFVPSFHVPVDRWETFELMVQELIDYRLASYEARSGEASVDSQKNVIPMDLDGTELPYFPTLKIACGHFRNSRVEAEEYRKLSMGYGRLDPARHFIARASGNSMNGGKNPIHDGDYLLLEQINPERAGSITGKTLAIERVDEVGDTQYLLRTVLKSSAGQYMLRAANREYEDLVVTPELSEQFRTFARLEAVITPLEMAIGQKFMREDIPALFGENFNVGSWNSGHVFLKDANAHVLLVTLNKQGKINDHRYVDHWIDEQTFHWQSQRSTTPDNKRGRELINHEALGLSVHLFVREHRLQHGKAAPFTYYGPVFYQCHEGSAPMSVIFRLAGS